MFNQNSQYGNMQSPTPIQNAISNGMDAFVQSMIRSGGVNQQNGAQFRQEFQRYIPNIASELSSQYPSGVQSEVLNQTVIRYGQALLLQLQQQQQPQGYPQPNMGIGYPQPNTYNQYRQPQNFTMPQTNSAFGRQPFQPNSLSQGAPSMNLTPPQQLPAPIGFPMSKGKTMSNVIDANVIEVTGRAELLTSGNPEHRYTKAEDLQASTKYSTNCKSGSIVGVSKKYTINDELNNYYEYSVVKCSIAEPSLKRVLDNFASTNPKLCIGNWISLIEYSLFDLQQIKQVSGGNIDLSLLANLEHRDLPSENIIREVISNIQTGNFEIASIISDKILAKFNALSKRFLRSESMFYEVLSCPNIKDIISMATDRTKELMPIIGHKNYEDTLLLCFKQAVEAIITQETPKGYFEVEEIVGCLLASPKFVIRQEGLVEREYDLSNQDFLNAVKAKFCTIGNIGQVAYCNFIPDELDSDLIGNTNIKVGFHTSVLDFLITKLWDELPEMIIMNNGDQKLVVNVGRTLEGTPFIFRGDDSILKDC